MNTFLQNLEMLNEDLKNNLPCSLEDFENKISNAAGGFLGYIPDFILKNFPKNKSEIDFFQMFDVFVDFLKKNDIQSALDTINLFFENAIVFEIFKNHYDGMHISFGVILKNNICNEELFLKVFKPDYKAVNLFYYRHGPFVEPAVAMFINSHLKNNNNFLKFYFANSLKGYMVSEYVKSVCHYADSLNAYREEVKKMENLTDIIISELFEEFIEKITGEKINHYKTLKSMPKERFRGLDYQAENFIIYEDAFGQKHCKMIDYGYIIKYKNQ